MNIDQYNLAESMQKTRKTKTQKTKTNNHSNSRTRNHRKRIIASRHNQDLTAQAGPSHCGTVVVVTIPAA